MGGIVAFEVVAATTDAWRRWSSSTPALIRELPELN